MKRTYFVVVAGEDPVVVNVQDDVNRPNNPDCESVLNQWVSDNFGDRSVEYWEIETCETISI